MELAGPAESLSPCKAQCHEVQAAGAQEHNYCHGTDGNRLHSHRQTFPGSTVWASETKTPSKYCRQSALPKRLRHGLLLPARSASPNSFIQKGPQAQASPGSQRPISGPDLRLTLIWDVRFYTLEIQAVSTGGGRPEVSFLAVENAKCLIANCPLVAVNGLWLMDTSRIWATLGLVTLFVFLLSVCYRLVR